MRTRKKKWTKAELEANPRMIHCPKEYKGRWQEYFGNAKPIHLELGCGKGRFITTLSAANPEVNYLAFERESEVIAIAAKTSHGTNGALGFIIGDAKDLPEYFEKGELRRIYINFCDPWPSKSKWAKRRLTHMSFLEIYKEIMGDHGELFFKTDNRELFEFSLNQFCEQDWKLRNISLDLHNSKYRGRVSAEYIRSQNIMTEYEQKFHSKDMPIYRCEAYY